ncbi:MAG: PAS domain S-box protein [Chloroflexi bacterium]|nr:MAG: PAS domain S-box protein [Chloroflexota bacterium]
MNNQKNNKQKLDHELKSMKQQLKDMEGELKIQKEISIAVGIFQSDVTVRTLLESITEGVIICTKDGRIVMINSRAEELFGYQTEEVTGRLLNILLPERFFKNHAKLMSGFFESPIIRPMGKGIDLAGKRKDGSEFPVEIALSFLHTEVDVLGLAFVSDITERKQAEWALKLKNEELDSFAQTVAHNLKASLSAITGYSEILADTHTSLSETERITYIDSLARNSRRMNNIIDELLVFASIRQEDIKTHTLPMTDIVENVIQRINFQLKESNGQVVMPPQLHQAIGYIPWVEEIWYNYMTNAIKYGGKPPLIEIGSEPLGEFVKFWVKDNGAGIPEADQEALFEPYVQLAAHRIEGNGLGLSIVKKIAQKLDGKVELESEVGTGSIFSFYLKKG